MLLEPADVHAWGPVVPDEDEAQSVVDFAKSFKLLSGKVLGLRCSLVS